MTSQINPNDIVTNYPVAGQPNNTQGFRDNFTNIQNNFGYAEDEINDLQLKVVLKAALIGTTLDNNMNDALIYAATIRDFSATAVNITATSGSIAVNYSAGLYQSISTTGNISLSFSNFPVSGTVGLIRIQLIIDTAARTVTLPAAVNQGTIGVQGYSGSVITFAQPGTFEFAFLTNSNGFSITMFDLNRPLLAGTGNAIGYSTGAGGTVTQATNKSTAVTLNTNCGQVTMNAAALAADTTVSFTLTNSTIAAGDVLVLNHISGGTAGSYLLNAQSAAGSASINVRNITSGSLSQAIVIAYVVIKAVTA